MKKILLYVFFSICVSVQIKAHIISNPMRFEKYIDFQLFIPSHYFPLQASNNFQISCLTYGNYEWAVVMTKGVPYSNQTWKTNANFPQDWIKEKWNNNYYITSLSYGGGNWAVVMNKTVKYSQQSWNTNANFPQDWVRQKWDENFHITSLAYGNGVWGVIMSKNSGYGIQSWKTDKTFPQDWIRQKWDDNFHITAIAYGNGLWAVVMSKNSGYGIQSWKTNNTFPKDWIREKWDDNFYITSITYGGGLWAVTMSKNTSFQTQSWNKSSNFPETWITQKWNEKDYTPSPQPTRPTTPSVNSRLHVVIVANTLVSDIGKSCQVDRDRIVNELEVIAREVGLSFSKTIIEGQNLTKTNVQNALNNLRPNPNDVVIFVYTGHGFRWANQTERYPMMDLRYSNYQRIAESNSLNLATAYNTITQKGARLNIVLGDCCNSNVGITSRNGELAYGARPSANGRIAQLKRLFLQAKGNLIVAAAQPNETACGSSLDGGFLISGFFRAILQETREQDTPHWNTVIQQSIEMARNDTRNSRSCGTQNGIFKSTIK